MSLGVLVALVIGGCGGGSVGSGAASAPTGLTATAAPGQVTFTWDAFPDAASYNLYVASEYDVGPTNYAARPNGQRVTGITTTSRVVTGVPGGILLYGVVTAVTADGETLPSTWTFAVLPPTAPTGVAAIPLALSANVYWTLPKNATISHVLMASVPGVTKENFAGLPDGRRIDTTTVPAAFVGLDAAKTYYFSVYSSNASGDGPISAEVSATPLPAPPTPPQGVTAVAGQGEVTLDWIDVGAGTTYHVYYAAAPGVTSQNYSGLPGGTKITTSPPLLLQGLQNGVLYSFVVRAENVTGISADSARVSATPSARGTFVEVQDIATGAGATASAAADFDGDGITDLAVANRDDANVAILIGDGTGTFQAGSSFGVGMGPVALIAGDFNGDGLIDVASANADADSVSVLLGNGDGTFQGAQDYYAGTRPVSLATGVFTSSGVLDIVVAAQDDNAISFLMGWGDGSFSYWGGYYAGNGPSRVLTAPMDGDGTLDLVVLSRGGASVSVLLGFGDGSFAWPSETAAGTDPADIAMGDFDEDSWLDVVVADAATGDVLVLLSNGDGTLSGGSSLATGAQVLSSLTVGDYDGDAHLDAAAVDAADGTVHVCFGDGTGGFSSQDEFGGGTGPTSILTGDFDGDGILDLAITDPTDGTLGVFAGQP